MDKKHKLRTTWLIYCQPGHDECNSNIILHYHSQFQYQLSFVTNFIEHLIITVKQSKYTFFDVKLF